jgi:AcrR family transcriptional regulator
MASEVTPDELEPPWWRPPKGQGRRRAPLSRDAIVDAALAILDADGVDALTIRRLGQELGTGAASLYWHLAGKDELCELVYDRIMGEIELPDPDPSRWEEQLKELARQAYRAMLSHNDAVRLSIGRPPAGPNTLRIVEWMLGLMRGAGIPDQPAAYFGNILGRFLDASVLEDATAVGARNTDASQEDAADMMRDYWARLPAERFPNIIALADTTFAGDADALFEFGLDLLIRGLAAYKEPSARH